mgnify:FL=1
MPQLLSRSSRPNMTLQIRQLAHKTAELASSKQASDIVLLDITDIASFADYFLILTADSTRLMNAIREDIVKSLTEAGIRLDHQEGVADSGWILLDYGDVIIHIFAPEERQAYRLERLWSQGIPVIRFQ